MYSSAAASVRRPPGDGRGIMTPELAHTWFAPAERTTPAELRRKIGLLTNNPVTDTIMRAVDGLMAGLDENRQILAVNQAFLAMSIGVGANCMITNPMKLAATILACDLLSGRDNYAKRYITHIRKQQSG